jgi:PBP1b-binding outer membrane lipoprotein LpoB
MKHILLLTLVVATVAFLGGCAGEADYGSSNHDQTPANHFEPQQPSMGSGGY